MLNLLIIKKKIDIKPEKIILVGDSAGGNLILGVV
jgi:acetyl esterase/lipase